MQGPSPEDCYHASHLQCLIGHQREELLREEMGVPGLKRTLARADLVSRIRTRGRWITQMVAFSTLGLREKRMRTEPPDFEMCREYALSWIQNMGRAYAAKEQSWAASEMNQQMLLNELQQWENVIEHLQKVRVEEQHKMQQDIYRLERELHMMERLLEGYRMALKESNRAFADYRAKCPQLDKTIYRDVPGSGGLVLSVTELERQRLKREEEERRNVLIIKERIQVFEAMWSQRFKVHVEGADALASRLLKVGDEMKYMKDLTVKRKLGREKLEESADQEAAQESAGQDSADQEAAQGCADLEMAEVLVQAETEG
ncbi:hypothetical protein SAY86_029024 [Trapa natans]|uniref:Uncharacterized protein n=1 Tax=Trapa natans TaxID=22666 RepID=A0AAN7RGY9_TRANT|nr:hypothetical protein SAY86_029024 [Trapa natans]